MEAWQFQLDGLSDRYRLNAFDNRGVGRTPMPAEPLTVAALAEDAAALLRALAVPAAHVVGQSTGGVIAQKLALRHPELVRSLVLVSTWAQLDAYFRSTVKLWGWLVEAAPSERAFLEAFCLWLYTPRAHDNGLVDQVVQGALASRTRCRPKRCSAGWTPCRPRDGRPPRTDHGADAGGSRWPGPTRHTAVRPRAG